jgi:ABC-2 type transport system ATP-binding protein
MQLVAVDDVADTVILHLSKGYRQRVGIADALVASPPLLILDEPTIGLDPNQIREVRRLVRQLGERHTILLSTHILSEAESTCDRALVIHRGRLVAAGTIDQLRAQRRADRVSFVLRDPQARAVSLLGELPGIRHVRVVDDSPEPTVTRRVIAALDPEGEAAAALVEQAVRRLVEAGVAVREVGPGRATLEEVFAQLTRDDATGAAGDRSGDDPDAERAARREADA